MNPKNLTIFEDPGTVNPKNLTIFEDPEKKQINKNKKDLWLVRGFFFK